MDSLFVPALQPAVKHRTVFQKFDALDNGESFLLINDHDPIPLFYEMKAERGNVFEWKKVEDGPEVWKVEIRRIAESAMQQSKIEETAVAGDAIKLLNVTLIEPRLKHPTIFQEFDNLKAGEAFRILNDHDPKPLYYQLIAERGPVFDWQYIEKGPKWWQVEIKKKAVDSGNSVGEIAARDIRKAEVFKKYGIDFCCGGKKSLQQACEEKGLDTAAVEAELDSVQYTTRKGENFNQWEPDFLADYIYNKHHQYYYDEGPVIAELVEKVAAHHGDHHAGLITLRAMYRKLAEELSEHFQKEEEILFPFIKAAVQARKSGDSRSFYEQFTIAQPIQMMETDHEAAGEILVAMRNVANNYEVPEGGCNSFRFLYAKLSELEADLHQHIHLENNILFPKALSLEKELRK